MKTALAMVLEEPGGSLVARDRELHKPATGELLLEVLACGVCRTDLHLLDGELPGVTFPIVPGHQVVGRIVETDALIAGAARKTCAMRLSFTVTRSMAAMRDTCSSMSAIRMRWPRICHPSRRPRCYVPA
jgi:hypothetical protein